MLNLSNNTLTGFTENEISIKASGGTELTKRLITSRLDAELLQNFQIISSRPRELNPDLIRVMFFHDLPEDPESEIFRNEGFRRNFHGFVFVSDWQYQRYQLISGIPYSTKSVVIENPIVPFDAASIANKPKDKIRFFYSSTPQRGLDILVPTFAKLAETNPDIHLDVYSSFKIYGWEDADVNYEALFDIIRNHPQMSYHGFVSHDDLQKEIASAHVFAYPSTWLETSCRALIEAMSAGLVCIHPNLAGLPETSGHLTFMYHGDLTDRDAHATVLYNYMTEALSLIRHDKEKGITALTKSYADIRYNIDRIASNWETYLRSLLMVYPDAESRQIPEERFIFRTGTR